MLAIAIELLGSGRILHRVVHRAQIHHEDRHLGSRPVDRRVLSLGHEFETRGQDILPRIGPGQPAGFNQR